MSGCDGRHFGSALNPVPGYSFTVDSVTTHDIGNRRLRTGEVARRAGVNVQTLRYYERRGLIAEPARSPGGHRTYPADTVSLLAVIKAAQRLGFSLDEVAELLDTGRRRHTAVDLQTRARSTLADVEARISALQTIRATLLDVIDAGCDSLTGCTCTDCPLPFAELDTAPIRGDDR